MRGLGECACQAIGVGARLKPLTACTASRALPPCRSESVLLLLLLSQKEKVKKGQKELASVKDCGGGWRQEGDEEGVAQGRPRQLSL